MLVGLFLSYYFINLYFSRFAAQDVLSPNAGEIWFVASVLGGLVLFGFAVFMFLFGVLPYGFKAREHLNEVLSCWALTFPNGE